MSSPDPENLKKPLEYNKIVINVPTGLLKDKEVRQASAEYKVSQQGLRTLAVFNSTEFQDIKNMITWSRGSKLSHQETTDEENTSDSTSKPNSS